MKYLEKDLEKGDRIMVRWVDGMESGSVRKLHRCGKVQVLWPDGTVSSVAREDVQKAGGSEMRKRKLDPHDGLLVESDSLGRPKKKDRSVVELCVAPRFAPPICSSVLGPLDSRGVMFLPQFLTVPEIEVVTKLAATAVGSGLSHVMDRSDDLKFDHKAYRIDRAFACNSALFDKVVGTMRWADGELWNTLGGPETRLYPEVEFIRYECDEKKLNETRKYAIEPHVDNHSAVTLVCLLSRPHQFQGGILGFKALELNGTARLLQLTQGDAVAFRGEKLLHWVTPVTTGIREVLQLELSRI